MAEPATTPPVIAGPQRDVLLATKLHVPPPRPGLVARPRLDERLGQGMGRELVLVCTPAGFGKTTLLAEWVRAGQRPVAWLSLERATTTRPGSGALSVRFHVGVAPLLRVSKVPPPRSNLR
jgi:hypothetical protein